jgi:hypothetical protein
MRTEGVMSRKRMMKVQDRELDLEGFLEKGGHQCPNLNAVTHESFIKSKPLHLYAGSSWRVAFCETKCRGKKEPHKRTGGSGF